MLKKKIKYIIVLCFAFFLWFNLSFSGFCATPGVDKNVDIYLGYPKPSGSYVGYITFIRKLSDGSFDGITYWWVCSSDSSLRVQYDYNSSPYSISFVDASGNSKVFWQTEEQIFYLGNASSDVGNILRDSFNGVGFYEVQYGGFFDTIYPAQFEYNGWFNILYENSPSKNQIDTIINYLSTVPTESQIQQIIDLLNNNSNSVLDEEQNRAETGGSSSIDSSSGTVNNAIGDSSSGVISALGNLTSAMSYNGTECAWTFPTVYLPEIPGVMSELKLIDEQPIDFSFWVSKLPSSVLTVVQNLGTVCLVIFCFKELYGTISYVLTLRDSYKGDD